MISPYKRIKEDIIKPWLLTDEEKDNMVYQMSKLRQNWTDFQSFVLGQGKLAHLRLYRQYELVDVQWIIQYSDFEPNLQDLQNFLRRRLQQYRPKTIELFVHNRRSSWTTTLICYFHSPFYIPEDYLEYEFGTNIYRPKFKPIYKVDKYISTITTERPFAQKKIQFLDRFDTSSKPTKMIKKNEELIESTSKITKFESLPSKQVSSTPIQNYSKVEKVVEVKEECVQEVIPAPANISNDRISTLEQEFGQIKDILSQFIKIQQAKMMKDKSSSEKKGQKKKKSEEQNETPAKQSSLKEESQNKQEQK